jgi:uncharacterized coiled-coil protein SlyX
MSPQTSGLLLGMFMDFKKLIEANKERQKLEPYIKIMRDQFAIQLKPIQDKLDNLETKSSHSQKRTEKINDKLDEINMVKDNSLDKLDNGEVVPKFIEVQNINGDYYINADHIARIENTINIDGQFVVRVMSSAPDIGTICAWWDSKKEANKAYKRLKKALMSKTR